MNEETIFELKVAGVDLDKIKLSQLGVIQSDAKEQQLIQGFRRGMGGAFAIGHAKRQIGGVYCDVLTPC